MFSTSAKCIKNKSSAMGWRATKLNLSTNLFYLLRNYFALALFHFDGNRTGDAAVERDECFRSGDSVNRLDFVVQ